MEEMDKVVDDCCEVPVCEDGIQKVEGRGKKKRCVVRWKVVGEVGSVMTTLPIH